MVECHGNCHCGRIRLALRDQLISVSECNCSFCRRTAGLWHYCPPEMVSVEGEGVAYQRVIAHSPCGIARPVAGRHIGRRPFPPTRVWESTLGCLNPIMV
jgi:hypothetical protein